jgi:hypothetical protein
VTRQPFALASPRRPQKGSRGIRKTLLDTATGAVRDHWITFECGECGTRERVEVPVPDIRASGGGDRALAS